MSAHITAELMKEGDAEKDRPRPVFGVGVSSD